MPPRHGKFSVSSAFLSRHLSSPLPASDCQQEAAKETRLIFPHAFVSVCLHQEVHVSVVCVQITERSERWCLSCRFQFPSRTFMSRAPVTTIVKISLWIVAMALANVAPALQSETTCAVSTHQPLQPDTRGFTHPPLSAAAAISLSLFETTNAMHASAALYPGTSLQAELSAKRKSWHARLAIVLSFLFLKDVLSQQRDRNLWQDVYHSNIELLTNLC